MFDIGFSELLLVALVALLVFGPERLPAAVRTGSLWLGRLKRSFQSIKQEVEREIGADEIRRQLHNENILQMERELKDSLQSIQAPSIAASPPVSEPTTATAVGAPEPLIEPAAPTALGDTLSPDAPEPPRQP